MEQLYRQDLLLALLPGKEAALNRETLHQRVRSQGIEVNKRTILRDLLELETTYPHVHSRPNPPKGKAKLWWADKALSRLSMLPTDAMNLMMIMEHASRFGMAAQVQKLAPLQEYARSLLNGKRPAQDWSTKVISNARFITLAPSRIVPAVLETLQQALLDDHSVEAMYLKRGAHEPKRLCLRPLGLSYQDSNIYLSCVFEGLEYGKIAALELRQQMAKTARSMATLYNETCPLATPDVANQ